MEHFRTVKTSNEMAYASFQILSLGLLVNQASTDVIWNGFVFKIVS